MRSYFNFNRAVMLRMRAAAKRQARGGQCMRLQQKIPYASEVTRDSADLASNSPFHRDRARQWSLASLYVSAAFRELA